MVAEVSGGLFQVKLVQTVIKMLFCFVPVLVTASLPLSRQRGRS